MPCCAYKDRTYRSVQQTDILYVLFTMCSRCIQDLEDYTTREVGTLVNIEMMLWTLSRLLTASAR